LAPGPYALRPLAGYPTVQDFLQRRDALLLSAVPAGTRANEKSSWRKWEEHCRTWGTPPWRANLEAYSLAPEAGPARQDLLTLAASFIEYCYLTMVPRARNTHPKPQSAYKNWSDIARIHQRAGFPKLDPAQLGRYVKALTLDYKARYGFDALLEKRKEPIRDAEYRHLLTLPAGTVLGAHRYLPDSRFGLTWRALHSVLNHTGFRKGEWAVTRRGDRTLMTYAQLAWELDGHASRQPPTPLQVARLHAKEVKAVAILFPVPSKCDPDGSAFCNKGIPFPVDPADPECAGALLLRLETVVAPGDRNSTPLFADEQGLPLVGADMDRALHDALSLYNPQVAATRSWHSYRIRLASKLRAARTPSGAPAYSDAVIQALLRWKTPASLNIYARYDTSSYAAILRSVQDVDISTVQYSNLPETSEFERLDLLAATAESGIPAAVAPARRPPATGASPPPPAAALPIPPPAVAPLPGASQGSRAPPPPALKRGRGWGA